MLRRFVFTAIAAFAATLTLAPPVAAQTGVLAGTVYAGEHRLGLEGATVTIVGTKLSAVTGPDGRFVISGVPAGDVELRVQRANYFTLADRVRIAASDTTRGYYQLIDPAAEEKRRAPTAAPKPEVMIGDSVTVSFGRADVRPAPEPLIIVDGVIVNRGAAFIREMNPNGIESIEVLKGEAAKDQYGSRAGDGVIVIRTKPMPAPPPPLPPPPAPAPPPPQD